MHLHVYLHKISFMFKHYWGILLYTIVHNSSAYNYHTWNSVPHLNAPQGHEFLSFVECCVLHFWIMQLASPKLQLLAKYGLLVHQQKQSLKLCRIWCTMCTRFWCVTVDGGTYVNKDCWSTGSLPVSYNCTSILVTYFKMCKCSCASPEPSPGQQHWHISL